VGHSDWMMRFFRRCVLDNTLRKNTHGNFKPVLSLTHTEIVQAPTTDVVGMEVYPDLEDK
jgi:hypothetical protein